MNKFSVITAAIVSSITMGSVALADTDAQPYRPDISQSLNSSTNRWHAGFEIGLGVPAGATVSLVVNPRLNWLQLGAGVGYNYLAFGPEGFVKLDPLALLPKVPIGIFGEFRAGIFPVENIPGHSSDIPGVGYSYESFQAGLRLGRADHGFRWDFKVGEAHIDAHTSNFQSRVASGNTSGVTFGNPTASGWIPAVSMGPSFVW